MADSFALLLRLSGHRERVAAKGERGPLHLVLAEFQALIDRDPVVRM